MPNLNSGRREGDRHYIAFGLRVRSNQDIPGLSPVKAMVRPDVTITFGARPFEDGDAGCESDPAIVECEPDKASEPWLMIWKHRRYFQLRYADSTEFYISRAGDEIWATWPDELTLADTATYLLGPIANVVLRLRGTIALHASAVRIGDVAVAFVGPQGAGKSTIAAFFAKAGYPVLTDDTAALEDGGESFRVVPAYPRVRLWPQSVDLLLGSGDALPRLTPGWDKRYLPLDDGRHAYEHEAIPLAAIYFLEPRLEYADAPQISDEPSRGALVRLIGNIGGNTLLGEADAAKTFELLNRLARVVPLRRLAVGAGAEALHLLCDAVRQDVRALHAMPA